MLVQAYITHMKKILTLLLLSLRICMYAQGYTAEYAIGYGNYQLNDIKSIQKSMVGNYGLKITDCFPGYYTHTVTIGYLNDKNQYGGQFSYLTTGGKLSVADYSGAYNVEMYMNGYRIGGFYRNLIPTGYDPIRFYLQVGSGIMFSNMRMNERMTIYSESQASSVILKGGGYYIEPSLGFTFRLLKCCNVSVGGGYEIDIPGKMFYGEQKTDVSANWSGVRVYGGVTILLPENIFGR